MGAMGRVKKWSQLENIALIVRREGVRVWVLTAVLIRVQTKGRTSSLGIRFRIDE